MCNSINCRISNTHFTLTNSVYLNYPAVKNAFVNLGVRHIRDGFSISNPQNFEANLGDLSARGIHNVLTLSIFPDAGHNAIMNVPADVTVAYLQAGHFLGATEAVEDINEPDVNHSNPSGRRPSVGQPSHRRSSNFSTTASKV